MGIIPTIESTIDEFERSTSCRIEIDNGRVCIAGNGPLLFAAHELKRLQNELNAAKELLLQLCNDAKLYRVGGIGGQQMGQEHYQIIIQGTFLGKMQDAIKRELM